MSEEFLRAQTSKYQCASCKRGMADCRINGIGIQFVRPHPSSKPKLVMRICVQCRGCDEIGSIGAEASPKLWEQCQAHVLETNSRDPFGPASVNHIQAMADDQPVTHPGKRSKQTKRHETKRKRLVRPSIRPGTPDTPITWDEQRKFLRQTSFNRCTKTFEKWIERMTPRENHDPLPPF
ncbi:hypothetical protein OT109_09370 [Phycisphaeraceae bacterium D3-23]